MQFWPKFSTSKKKFVFLVFSNLSQISTCFNGPWRKNQKSRRYRRERDETKFTKKMLHQKLVLYFLLQSFLENAPKNSKNSPLFGGPIWNSHRQFFFPLIMAHGWMLPQSFLENTPFLVCFQGRIEAAFTHGPWWEEKKLTVRSPPNNHNPFLLQSARAMNKKSLKSCFFYAPFKRTGPFLKFLHYLHLHMTRTRPFC